MIDQAPELYVFTTPGSESLTGIHIALTVAATLAGAAVTTAHAAIHVASADRVASAAAVAAADPIMALSACLIARHMAYLAIF